MIALALTACVLGCNPAPINVTARRLVPIQPGEIRTIAVLPFTQAGLQLPPPQPGQEPIVEPPADTVTRAMAEAMRRYPDWQIVDPAVVTNTFVRMFGEVRPPTAEEALAVGKRLAIDAVVRGQVDEFVERIGTEIAAKEPARVVFAVEIERMPSGQRVWQAQYAESQQALSDNLWDVGGFFRAGAKWVRAAELARIGAEQVTVQLHEALTGSSKPPPPQTARRPPQ